MSIYAGAMQERAAVAIAAFTIRFSIIRSHYMPIVSRDTVMHLIVLTIRFFLGLRKKHSVFQMVFQMGLYSP